MNRLSAWFIRLSLLYLAAGFSLGALLLAARGFPLYSRLADLLPTHAEFLLVGWLIQLALGVAYWILPRFTHGPPRGNETIGWSILVLFNAGILLAAGGGLLPIAGLQAQGRGFEAAGILAFIFLVWRRVRPYG